MASKGIAALAALALLAPAIARGQPGGAPAPAPSAPAATPAAAADAPPSPDAAAHADYDDAFAAMLAGDFAKAAIGFDGVAARAQDPELAAAARELARLAHELVARKLSFVAPPPAPAPGATEERDEGRTSFVVWTTMFGAYAGVVIIDDTNLDDFRAGIVTVTGTTALGLFGSLYATRGRRMTGAMADAYSLGMIEGVGNAGLLASPAGLDTSEKVQTTLLVSGAVGGAAGLLYGYELEPTRGQVAFASTLSLLGFASTGLSIGLVRPKSMDGDTALTMMAGGTDVGLAAGLSLGRDLDWSVSRGRIVQLGSFLGALAGLAAGALITGANANSDDDTRVLTGATLAGVWGGFAIAISATRGMQPDARYVSGAAASAPHAQLAPIAVRGGAGLAVVGSF
jgi:hypothetical protein